MNRDFVKACGTAAITAIIGTFASSLAMKAIKGVNSLIKSKKTARTPAEEPLTVETENEKKEN